MVHARLLRYLCTMIILHMVLLCSSSKDLFDTICLTFGQIAILLSQDQSSTLRVIFRMLRLQSSLKLTNEFSACRLFVDICSFFRGSQMLSFQSRKLGHSDNFDQLFLSEFFKPDSEPDLTTYLAFLMRYISQPLTTCFLKEFYVW